MRCCLNTNTVADAGQAAPARVRGYDRNAIGLVYPLIVNKAWQNTKNGTHRKVCTVLSLRKRELHLFQFPTGAGFQVGVDEPVQVAVHDSLHVAAFKVGAVILDQRVGHKDVAADLVAPGDLVLHALDSSFP